MNILDENISATQRYQLDSWHISTRQIGNEVGRQGMSDAEIIPLLLQIPRTTFFTRDLDFYRRQLCHAHYCIAYLAVSDLK